MSTMNIRLFFSGNFHRSTYSGGDSMLVPGVELDEFSYTVLMEYVKDYLHFSEIGGVYVSKGKKGGWKLITADRDVLGHLADCLADDEVNFYIDNHIDTGIEPLPQMQPHVIVRPRKNIVQDSVNKHVDRQYVTTHQLQWKQKQQKLMKGKSPEIVGRRITRSKDAEQERGSVKRKLQLEGNTSDDQESGADEMIAEQLPPPPPLPMSEYERQRLLRVEQNKKVIKELGLKEVADGLISVGVKKVKGKKATTEDDYNPEFDSESASDDTSPKAKKVQEKKKIAPGPRTRSRANAATIIEMETTHTATETAEPEETQIGTATQKAVPSKVRSKVLKPSCSKLLKQPVDNVAAGSISAYLALREKQKQGLEGPEPHEVPEANMEDAADEEIEKVPRKPRGRSKMTKVHARAAAERPIIMLNKHSQPISEDGRVDSELSRFLGTVVKDNVPLTYVNWHVVPAELKKFMWEYTRQRYIIPDEAQWWVNRTLADLWRVHKSRIKKKYYTKYNSDEERLQNRPEDIPLEDFKQLLIYWGDDEIKSIAEDNAERRNSYTDTHTIGPKSLAQVRADLKKKDPNQASPSNAKVYFETRERKKDREYMPTAKAVKKRIKRMKKLISSGKDPEILVAGGKDHGREWLVGRSCKNAGGTSAPSSTDPYVEQLTRTIKESIESELEAKVNRKVQENMTMLLKKLEEANPGMKLDVDIRATVSSDGDDNGTPVTAGETS